MDISGDVSPARRSAVKFQGRNSSTFSGTRLPAAARLPRHTKAGGADSRSTASTLPRSGTWRPSGRHSRASPIRTSPFCPWPGRGPFPLRRGCPSGFSDHRRTTSGPRSDPADSPALCGKASAALAGPILLSLVGALHRWLHSRPLRRGQNGAFQVRVRAAANSDGSDAEYDATTRCLNRQAPANPWGSVSAELAW